jgi:hypothetical protein
VLAAALLALVRRRGVAAIAVAGTLFALVVPGQGVSALAVFAALALTCVGIALADADRPVAAGAAIGVALLMRFDWGLTVTLAALPYLVVWPWRSRLRAVGTAALVASPYVPYFAVVGIHRLRVMFEQLRVVERGRGLPVTHWPYFPGYVLDAMLVSIVLLALVGWRLRRTREGISFLSVALLGVGLVPYATSRADRAHILVAAIAPVVMLAAVVPAAIAELRAPFARLRRPFRIGALAAVAIGAVWLALPIVQNRRYEPLLALDDFPSSTIEHDGRVFRIANDYFAQTAQQAVDRAAELAPPGGRLFVGPGDLRRTNYADSYFYFLLPELKPASYYMEMSPGTSQPDSGLADELHRADVLILNTVYDAWYEPNDSVKYGSGKPNEVVKREFCRDAKFGYFLVYKRC